VSQPAPCTARQSLKRLFTAKEAAEYLGFSSPWPVRQLQWNGKLPVVQLSKRRIAFDLKDLDAYIEAAKVTERD
jgi:excisionase family DNA binding protein